MSEDGGASDNDSQGESYTGDLHLGPSVPHYYGDYVRQIFVALGAGLLVLAPFFMKTMPFFLPIIIVGTVVIVCLAAITNPHNQLVHIANSIAAGLGVVIFEVLSLISFGEENMILFAILEAFSIGFLIALYFSMKTLRAMILHQVGKREMVGEFLEEGNE